MRRFFSPGEPSEEEWLRIYDLVLRGRRIIDPEQNHDAIAKVAGLQTLRPFAEPSEHDPRPLSSE